MVNHCIERRIRFLRGKHINRRKHVLKSRKHLNYLRELQCRYVLVPADKATNNACKKYYLEVVQDINAYEFVDKGCESMVVEHFKLYGKQKYYSSAGASTFSYHRFIGLQLHEEVDKTYGQLEVLITP